MVEIVLVGMLLLIVTAIGFWVIAGRPLRAEDDDRRRSRTGARRMDEDTAVSLALVNLYKAARIHVAAQRDLDARVDLARQAEEFASQWPQSWVAKSVIFLARSFFLLEATRALEVFGGQEKLLEMMQAGGVEGLFLRGHGAAFRGEADAAIQAFVAADAIRPNDPFILFSLLCVLTRFGTTHHTHDALRTHFFRSYQDHPLYKFGQELVS
jgi:hypothetical protein